jgi:RNA polymerase sigma-70 factor (ECF subfamily)
MAAPAPKDREVFSHLVQDHHARIFGYVFSLVRNLEDTQDVMQETCVTLWEKFDDYDPATPFLPWALTVARFRSLSYLDRRRRRHFSPQVVAELEATYRDRTAVADEQRLEGLRHCIHKLPSAQAQLLWRCYEGPLSIRQIAAELGRTPSSLHNSLRHIRQKLLDCIHRTQTAENGG